MAEHYHILIVNHGVSARLPGTITKDIAIEVAITWMGGLAAMPPQAIADLANSGFTTKTQYGLVQLHNCVCEDEMLTQQKVIEIAAHETATRRDQ